MLEKGTSMHEILTITTEFSQKVRPFISDFFISSFLVPHVTILLKNCQEPQTLIKSLCILKLRIWNCDKVFADIKLSSKLSFKICTLSKLKQSFFIAEPTKFSICVVRFFLIHPEFVQKSDVNITFVWNIAYSTFRS